MEFNNVKTTYMEAEPKRLKQLQSDTGRGENVCRIALCMEDNQYHKAKEYVDNLRMG